MIILLFFFISSFDLIRDYQISHLGNGNILISWSLTEEANEILLCEGSIPIATLPGNTTSYELTKTQFGQYQYSIGWSKYGYTFQWETSIITIGKIVWTPVPEVDGYALIIGDTLPLPNPVEGNYIDIIGQSASYILIEDLLDYFPNNVTKYAAIASYVDTTEERVFSALTDPIEVKVVYKLAPWKPKIS